MRLDSVINQESQGASQGHETFYTDPFETETLNTRILEVYEWQQALSVPLGGIITTTGSTSTLSTTVQFLIESAQQAAEQLQKWNASAWSKELAAASARQPELFARTASPVTAQTSQQRDSTVDELIAQARKLNMPFAGQLAKRLEYLAETSLEEYPDQAPISPQSLRSFIDFVRSIPNLVFPTVVLTPAGNIRAEWTKTRNKHLAIEFLPNGDVRFVVFVPDPKKPYKTARVSGLSTIDSIIRFVHPYGVLQWVLQATEDAA